MSNENLEKRLKELESFYVKNFIAHVQRMQWGAEKKNDNYIKESVEYLHDKISEVELDEHYSGEKDFEVVAKIKEIIEDLYKEVKNPKNKGNNEYYDNIEKQVQEIDKLRRIYSTEIDETRKKLGKESTFDELKD